MYKSSKHVVLGENKKLRHTGYRLFHGKFLTFMAVPRYTGLTVSGEMTREALTPSLSEINFSVPSRSTIIKNNDSPIPSLINPGVIHETLETVSFSSFSKIMCRWEESKSWIRLETG